MVDFIEYVVAELKSKRLSKANAVSLVSQFSRRSSGMASGSIIHPLLHSNTSDLSEQRYSTTFTGEEFFLADHQVKVEGQPGRKVLPGVAYLEMARAAIEQAMPERAAGMVLELRNTVWAQPVVVSGNTRVDIALLANDDGQIDYEVYSAANGEETIHCQGRAVLDGRALPAALDLVQLKARMSRDGMTPAALYATCARMGLLYGAAFQGVVALHRGEDQVLAELRLPEGVESAAGDYVLHPSLLDSALQSAVGLLEDGTHAARLPFALESLRIVSPCVREMRAWVRYAPGSRANDKVVKLDVDLCDAQGNICVQMHGLSSRMLDKDIAPAMKSGDAAGALFAVRTWETGDSGTASGKHDYAEHHVLLCELPKVDARKLSGTLARSQCRSLQAQAGKTLAERYGEYALICFERVQSILQSRPEGKVLIQVVVPDQGEQAMLAGLSGLLKTASLENPQCIGQLILMPAQTTTKELARHLQHEAQQPQDALVHYGAAGRRTSRWQELQADRSPAPVAFREQGVYLITGGLGGLGMVFARAILETPGAKVVLTGRSALSDENRSHLEALSPQPDRLHYRQVDLGDLDQVVRLIADIRENHGALNGMLHSAGMIADNFILKKTPEEFAAVLAPKVIGTSHLDEASRDVELDFFVLFSSMVGAFGNQGQADYASANAFMDGFAAHRNALVAAGQRHGRTRSIDWPLWQAGGMEIDAESLALLENTRGMRPMQTATGLDAFHRSLVLDHAQIMVAEGDVARMREALLFGGAALATATASAPQAVAPVAADAQALTAKTEDFLRKALSGLLKLPASRIDPRAAMEAYGIDSILAMQLTNVLEQTFGSLPKTLFFEYQTIRELARYFVDSHTGTLASLFDAANAGAANSAVMHERMPASTPTRSLASEPVVSRRSGRSRAPAANAKNHAEPIAIIGLSGRYPEAVDIEAYWRNLRDGKDCIIEVPEDRWDWRQYFSEDRSESGRHYSKWGGFIAGVDEFDPLFFNISPREAELIDPQERLFLQHAWMAVEDAGYSRESLQIPDTQDLAGQVGVYVGLMYTEYQLFGADISARGNPMGIAVSAASIANRVSYAMNLHGPSMTLDTMCSSSLTAIHIACQDLKQGRISLAIAGGVNVSIHPNKYLVLSEGQFISSDGHCQSFGEGGDGYIPGEGVGVVVLKRLSEAQRDGDQIYGLIRGSALNHGGKTNGYSVPNPQAQAGVVSRALSEAGIDARQIGYIEAHGTGTKLGDPIEIAALNKAFQVYTQDTGFCLIGSAKSNIGHCESAAGIAGLTKVLLQMRHRQIVPSLHSERLNPHIDFDKSPFVVNQSLRDWDAPVVDGRLLPRIAGISSFGAGGSNAHMLIEEYNAPVEQPVTHAQVVVVLSARTAEQLRQKARELLAFVRSDVDAIDATAMAYTLQVGREPMDERLGFVVSTTESLAEKLEAFVAGEEGIDECYQGQAKRNREALALFGSDTDLQQAVEKWIANRKLSKLAELWTKGLDVDWAQLYGAARPRRISLPTYPFAKERYWVDLSALGRGTATGGATTAVLHPLLHSNTSDLSEQRYSTLFTGDEFFLADHQVALEGQASRRILPGVAYLEMARAAIEQALPGRSGGVALELSSTVWAQPLVVSGETRLDIALSANDDGQIEYEIYSAAGGEETIHCQGRAVLDGGALPAALDLTQLKTQISGDSMSAATLYANCARMGLLYGPAFQAVTALHRGEGQVLSELRLPAGVESAAGDYVLHPSLLDGALQSAVGLLEEGSNTAWLPFALETLRVVSPCHRDMLAWVRYTPGSRAGDKVVKLDIDLCDAQGHVCVQMRGFSSRTLGKEIIASAVREAAAETLMAVPVWQMAEAAAEKIDYTQHHVLLCELPKVDARKLAGSLAGSRCRSLQSGSDKTLAERYGDYALACFEHVQTLLQGKPEGKVLVQVVVPDHGEQAVFAGLSGLLKTAALENPQLATRLILVPAQTSTKELAKQLQAELQQTQDALIKYGAEGRKVSRWQEVPADPNAAPMAFRDGGVYLITGGLGGLGMVFAKAILDSAQDAKVVLTGRSALSDDKRALLDVLSLPERLSYRQVDLGDAVEVGKLIAAIREEHGALSGILHSAGMIADNFILKKTATEFAAVLAPKVTGTLHLDDATRDVELDFFTLFSSMAGALGNSGQADYAAANGFMDCFAAYRNAQVAAGQRHGRTRSIAWPLWQAGGMEIGADRLALLEQTTGMRPMRTSAGLDAFHRALALPHVLTMVTEGDLTRMRRALLETPSASAVVATAALPLPAMSIDAGSLAEKTQDYLRKEFSGILKLAAHKIDPQAALEDYGIDSVLAMKLTNQLEQTFGSLSKTLFFEYQTIAALAGYLIKAHPAAVRHSIGIHDDVQAVSRSAPITVDLPRLAQASRNSGRTKGRFVEPAKQLPKAIAIVGLAGRYPQAENLKQFWDNLKHGRDCITEVPTERWDNRFYFDPDPNKAGKSYSKWGGFIDDADKFDPLFFNISPKEAELTDPQERLFLETVWQTIEDAGYSKESMASRRVGVFVGVMWGHYELFGAESVMRGNASMPTSSHASVANRISYFFDFHGPSLAIDTMCSSSLTAIHMACEELRKGEIEAAIAGGVNISVHPYKYLTLSQGKFVSSDGRCRSFGKGGDGYVPGEGVGAVLLKPLENALADGDQIYAVIKSSAINHGGKTNGYSVPNPNAQADLIIDACRKAGIDPKTLSYIETHGTGTSLGDPIEITGLSKAFEASTDARQFCAIGSVKSNIGHLEAAAGIAAVTKALLQIRHGQLAPSLHADPLNPNISFENTPFYVQTELAEWKRVAEHPRRVGVSSFGAGGANAHLIIEEHAAASLPEAAMPPVQPEAFVLSARDQDTLCRYAESMAAHIDDAVAASLADIAYTSQVGRTPMAARLVVVSTSLQDLSEKLVHWAASRRMGDARSAGGLHEPEDVYYGNVKEFQYGAGNLVEGRAGKAFLEELLASRDLTKIAKFWIMGVEIDWSRMRRHGHLRRVSLPTYPFARERYWIAQETLNAPAVQMRAVEVQKTAALPRKEDKRRMYFQPHWQPQPLEVLDALSSSTGSILILDATDTLLRALLALEGAAGFAGRFVLAKPGRAFERIDVNTYVLDVRQEEHFHQLADNLNGSDLFPAVVLHRGSAPCDLADAMQVEEGIDAGIHALLHLSKALMRHKSHAPPKIMSVYSRAAGERASLAAASAGFLKTLSLENPGYLTKTIEIVRGSQDVDPSLAGYAGLLLRELQNGAWAAKEVRYRDEATAGEHAPVRYARGLVALDVVANGAAALPLRHNGVYLVTGGLGGLGLIFAEYLAREYQAKLILVGRSAAGAKHAQMLARLEAHGAEVLCLQADVSSVDDMHKVVREAKARFSDINGVIHSAGSNRDAFILKKTMAEMTPVLAPKIHGAINLDLATQLEALDLFVLFASVAGAVGNVGQSDYAYANHFLDAFAEHRESMRSAGLRAGRTVSIDWPLWADGGMALAQDDIRAHEAQAGISPLPTEEGIRCWEDALRTDASQVVALYGIPSKIEAHFAPKFMRMESGLPLPQKTEIDAATLFAKTEAYLKDLIGEEIKLAPDRIASSERFESFGIESVMINRFNAVLERDFGVLPKTLFYEYESIDELAKYLIQYARDALIGRFGGGSVDEASNVMAGDVEEASEVEAFDREAGDEHEQIAIVGIHGRYPHSEDLDAFWQNLKQGRSMIDLVPSDRWDFQAFYDPDPAASADGKIYCKWGGFLDDHDKFDAGFFNIPAEEANIVDPQERIFLESVWAAIEDAGYTRESMKRMFPKGRSADVGVFVGVTTNSYHLLAAQQGSRGDALQASAMPWSIANRVSYVFDFNGPSMPIDTACSSSLVAVHLACESLKSRECQVAIAGGVNLYLHPSKYQSLCYRRMLSADGKCHSYGAGDDGFVPGEGVGTLVLKPLSRAIADQDRIYSVVSGSAYDHSGRSNGYSAPNPNSQASLIARTLKKAKVHPESISYIEGHGTGTQLGDGLEVAAMTQAFRKQTDKQQYCPIGSVKANVGHSESAAGMAGLAKVVLQIQHRQLAPSIHSDVVNPNIEFDDSPFYLQHELSEWAHSPMYPRRALINSFGAGGVNACVIVEEYDKPLRVDDDRLSGPCLFVLSARTEARLRDYADRLLARLKNDSGIDLASLCYTLQIGREAMEERISAVVSSVDDLIEQLESWRGRDDSVGVNRGSLDPRRGTKRSSKLALGERDLTELAIMWATGESVDWDSLYPGANPRRIGLPTYPFARDRHWVMEAAVVGMHSEIGIETHARTHAAPRAGLHPLISHNSSTLKETSFSSVLSDDAFYALDHKVNGEMIFPGAGFLEMACIAGNIAGEQRVRRIKDVVWAQPLSFRKGPQNARTYLKQIGDCVEYAIASFDEDNETIVHSEGRLTFRDGWSDPTDAEDRIAVQAVIARATKREDGATYYERFRQYGFDYGPAFRTLQEIHVGDGFAISRLRMAEHLLADSGQFILHPSMIDGALQTVAGLVGGLETATPHLPFALDEVDIVHPVPQTCYAYVEFADSGEQSSGGVRKFNIRLLNENGDILILLKNLYVRALVKAQPDRRSTAAA